MPFLQIDIYINFKERFKYYHLIIISRSLDKSTAWLILTVHPLRLFISTTIPEISSVEKSILERLVFKNDAFIQEQLVMQNFWNLELSKLV